jgi:hypothetical protein
MQPATLVGVAHQVAVDPDPAAVDGLQLVDAAQEGRLARARRPEEADDLALVDIHVDALEHLIATEGLGDIDRMDERRSALRSIRHTEPAPALPTPTIFAFSAWFFGFFAVPKPRPK